MERVARIVPLKPLEEIRARPLRRSA